MRNPKIAGTLMLATLCGVTAAFAGAGIVKTTVTPLQPNVTYSKDGTATTAALTTVIGFEVTISSDATNMNTINAVRFTATASVTDAAELAKFSSADGATCITTNAAMTSIECTIGQLRAGQTFPTFAVFFNAPVKITQTICPDPLLSPCADGPLEDKVTLSGITFYAEGTGGLENSVPQNSTVAWTTGPAVTLGTTNPTLVKSAVQKSGGTLFTGDGAVATLADSWTTTVQVPATAKYTTAEISEQTTTVPCAPDLLDCSTTTLAIPGSFSSLLITLRRDVSTIGKNARITNAKIYYDFPAIPDLRILYPYSVLDCADTTYGPLPQVGVPCILKRTEYRKNDRPQPPADFWGDWEFVIKALDNGKYSN